jgi:hypothetical protein
MANEVIYFPQLKDYIVEKRLGTGTYATVFKARSKVRELTFCLNNSIE